MRNTKERFFTAQVLMGLFLLFPSLLLQASPENGQNDLFAVVNGEEILSDTYRLAVANAGKNRFYHGKAPVNELESFSYEVGQQLINTTLLVQEAIKLNMPVDQSWVEPRLERLVTRLKQDPRWEQDQETIIKDLRDRLGKQSRLNQLEARAKELPPPTEEQIKAYYLEHADKFTTPARNRVSNILIKVEPWAPQDAWDSAKALAERLEKDIRDGADFAEIATEFSQDTSAEQGGDMGFQHEGMLGETVEKALAELQVGEMTKPVQLLEGYALFRLVEREPSKLNDLSAVRQKVEELWLREAKEEAYQNLLKNLREKASVEIKDSAYLELIKKYGDQVQKEAGK